MQNAETTQSQKHSHFSLEQKLFKNNFIKLVCVILEGAKTQMTEFFLSISNMFIHCLWEKSLLVEHDESQFHLDFELGIAHY